MGRTLGLEQEAKPAAAPKPTSTSKEEKQRREPPMPGESRLLVPGGGKSKPTMAPSRAKREEFKPKKVESDEEPDFVEEELDEDDEPRPKRVRREAKAKGPG